MIDQPITSSSLIKRVQHDGKDLTVTFRNGDSYKYSDVPENEVYNMLDNFSVGVYFSSNIKNKYPAQKL